MALQLLDEEGSFNIFSNSEEVSTGGGRERVGQATIVVSLDGTGDADSIQDGIDLLPIRGGVVFVKEGIYKIDTQINIAKNRIKIMGTGKGTKIIATTDISIFTITGDDITITDIHIEGNGSSTSDGILINANSNTTIRNCYIEENNYGIEIDTASNIIITECFIFQNDSSGIFTSGASGNNIISNNIIYSNGDEGIWIDGANTIIESNIIYSNTASGIEVAANSMTITGNFLNANGAVGINLRGGISYCIVSNNRIRNSTGDDINVTNSGCTGNIIVGNQVSGTNIGIIDDNGTDTQVGHNITRAEL